MQQDEMKREMLRRAFVQDAVKRPGLNFKDGWKPEPGRGLDGYPLMRETRTPSWSAKPTDEMREAVKCDG